MCLEPSKNTTQLSVGTLHLPDLAPMSIFHHKFQDSEQLTKFVVGIVRAFLVQHGFAKNQVNVVCEGGTREMVGPSPTEKKRKHGWEEAQMPMVSSFVMHTTSSTKGGRFQTSIDLTEYTELGGAMVLVCVSAAQGRCSLYDRHRHLLWIKRKIYSGSIRRLISLTKSIQALEHQLGFVKGPRIPFRPPQRTVLI